MNTACRSGHAAFVAGRLLIAEVSALDQELAGERGDALSLGCGYGALERYLSLTRPTLKFTGFELDRRRVDIARSGHAYPRVDVVEQDVTMIRAVKRFDVAMAIDVFHHLESSMQAGVLERLRLQLKDGGLCLIKDIARTPRWQHRWNAVHDRLVTGETELACLEPGDMAVLAHNAGFRVEGLRRLGRLAPYPHYLVRLRTADGTAAWA